MLERARGRVKKYCISIPGPNLLNVLHLSQVLQAVQALVHPVRLQRLSIQPVNLLVSIHASLKLYIASDHTPLSFSLFE